MSGDLLREWHPSNHLLGLILDAIEGFTYHRECQHEPGAHAVNVGLAFRLRASSS